jgi:ABC-type antimicrobial peptide transport system permease subunit
MAAFRAPSDRALAGDPRPVLPEIRRQIPALDGNLPVQNLATLTGHVNRSLWPARMGATFLGLFGTLGLGLAALGIYGVMAYSVVPRTREMGIRLALGAGRGDVLRLVVGQGLRLTGIGLGVGLALAFLATRLLSGFLYGVSATDAAVWGTAGLMLTGVAMVASFLPARTASRLDPSVTLRYE